MALCAPSNTVVSAPCQTGPSSAAFTFRSPAASSPSPEPPAAAAALPRFEKTPPRPQMTEPRSWSAWMPVSIQPKISPLFVASSTQEENDSETRLNQVARAGR